eukprot:2246419-Pleurochrysis_carterae.AAC.5
MKIRLQGASCACGNSGDTSTLTKLLPRACRQRSGALGLEDVLAVHGLASGSSATSEQRARVNTSRPPGRAAPRRYAGAPQACADRKWLIMT